MGGGGESCGIEEQLIHVGVVRVCIGRAREDRGVAEAVCGIIGERRDPALGWTFPDIVLNVCDRCCAQRLPWIGAEAADDHCVKPVQEARGIELGIGDESERRGAKSRREAEGDAISATTGRCVPIQPHRK